MDFESREYKIFQEEEFQEKNRFSIYEKLARLAGVILKIRPSSNKSLQEAIDFSGLKVTQSEVLALSIILGGISFLIAMTLTVLGVFTTIFSFFLIALSFGIGMQTYYYPKLYTRATKLKASSEIVLMVLYITIAMRQVPNLEHAIRFAAANLKGVISYQLRKLLWDIQTRRFENMESALRNYVDYVWVRDYPEVKEAFDLIISSTSITAGRRDAVLTEAIDIILQGAKERARHYSQDLRTPVNILNTMGILLPVIGLIMLPIITIFLTESINPFSVVLIYNIMLPFILVVSIYYVLQKRPWTFSIPDVSTHKGVAKRGMFSLAHIPIPALIPAIIVAIGFLILPVFTLNNVEPYSTSSLFISIFFIFALAFAIGAYMILNTFQKTELRDKIIRIEQSFAEALFTLGSKMADGAPIETALKKTITSLGDSPLADFFKITLRNIEEFGMTFEQAIFDKDSGSINAYPSNLMRSIFTIITKTSYKGSQAAAQSMIVISRYLKGMHDTEEEMKSVLSETTSSLEFQAWGLAPITTGIVVALAAAVQKILKKLEETFGSLSNYFAEGDGALGEETLSPFVALDKVMSPEIFQIVVGIYLVQVVIIICYFFVILTKGDEWISKQNYTGKVLILSVIIYALVLSALYGVFNALIPNLVGAV